MTELDQTFATLRILHPVGATRLLKDGLDRTVQVTGHRMALDCPSVQVRVLNPVQGMATDFPVKAHNLRPASVQEARLHDDDVLLGRDLEPEDKPALDAFYIMIQFRYGRRAANAAIDAAETAIMTVRAENREERIRPRI
jgi:hypothetical protein